MRNLVLAALVVVLAAGCGSSSTSSGGASSSAKTSGRPLTKAEFIARADAICAKSKSDFDPLQKNINAALQAEQTSDTATNRKALANAFNSAAQSASPFVDQLRALQPPPGDRVVIAKYLGSVTSNIKLLQQYGNAIAANAPRSVQTLAQQLNQGSATAKSMAQSYGFHVCGAGTS
jgi:hypothetical protein